MISRPELRKIARERKLPLDIIEKDYALGWILIGISNSSLRKKLIFKGGTALSKIYFPFNWRISEDLDFTLSKDTEIEVISEKLIELPDIVEKISDGITLNFKEKPFVNPGFLRVRVQYTGPISKNTVKIEVMKENFIGDFKIIKVSPTYDYPEFSTISYTLDNILAEKLRSIIERTRIRDYYDSWRLLKINAVNIENVIELFNNKCEGKGIEFKNKDQFFPENLIETLEPYLHTLTRLTSEALPPLSEIIEELRTDLTTIFA